MKFTTLAIPAFIAAIAEAGRPIAGNVKVVNRCDYTVYLWNVVKQDGCAKSNMVTLKKGDSWAQQMGYYTTETSSDDGGVSIKLSKSQTCGGQDITQLEYKLDWEEWKVPTPQAGENGNYLDMSFVDCQTAGNCPGFKDGYFLKSGNSTSDVATASDITHCPTFSVANEIQAAKVAYVLPNDVQTKFCPIPQDLSLWLCGNQAPTSDDESGQVSTPSSAASSSSAVSSSSAISSSSAASSSSVPSTTAKAPTTTSKASSDLGIAKAAAAAITESPHIMAPMPVKTVIEYVTVSVDAPVRRHTHGRRHQRIHA